MYFKWFWKILQILEKNSTHLKNKKINTGGNVPVFGGRGTLLNSGGFHLNKMQFNFFIMLLIFGDSFICSKLKIIFNAENFEKLCSKNFYRIKNLNKISKFKVTKMSNSRKVFVWASPKYNIL